MNEVHKIALAYAPRTSRNALSALWALDTALGRVVATTTEPMIGQMRLTWWHEQLTKLDAGVVPAEPVIAAVQGMVRQHDVTAAMLAGLVEGWEVLLNALPLQETILREFAAKRGDGLFAMSAHIMHGRVSEGPGARWALIDFAMHCSDQVTASHAWRLAQDQPHIIGSFCPKPLRILSRFAAAKSREPLDRIGVPLSRWEMLRAVLS